VAAGSWCASDWEGAAVAAGAAGAAFGAASLTGVGLVSLRLWLVRLVVGVAWTWLVVLLL